MAAGGLNRRLVRKGVVRTMIRCAIAAGICFFVVVGSVSAQTGQKPGSPPLTLKRGRIESSAPETREASFRAWKKICVVAADDNRTPDGNRAGDRAGDRGGDVCGLAYAGLAQQPDTLVGSASPLIAVTVQTPFRAKVSRPILIIRTRLGLLLPAGLELRIDGSKPVKAAFRSCHASRQEAGCIVPVRLAGDFLARARAGAVLSVSAKTLAGEALTQKLSLIGVTNALASLRDGS